ncbi:DHH family phosphoesterase [Streptococcus caprae]|uniref:Cyclic-di-AMP phosphodiesterase n=1 Tax=Streptococcus caprae TaxID=1640501 RepID=A0ABV8CV86_9STRE
MKKIRLATIHLVMIGLIVFGILALLAGNFQIPRGFMIILFLAIAFMVGMLYLQKQIYELTELEELEELNDQTEESLKSLLSQMPVGVVKFDVLTTAIEWFNPYAELIFSTDKGDFDLQTVIDAIENRKTSTANSTLEIADKKYTTAIDLAAGVFYFFEGTSVVREAQELSDFSPVIGVISIDNYDDVTESLQDSEVSTINAFIANFISHFSEEKKIFYRRLDKDRFYFFTDYAVLSDLMKNKFEILDQFRQQAKEQELALTMSMGISFGDHNHHEIGQMAQKNLNMALVRGGDQVVVKENDDSKDFQYFGGGSATNIKRTRTRTRAMMTAISDKIKSVDSVFVVGHKNLDMDALGSAVGMQFFASKLIEETYAVYDEQQMSPDIARAISRLKDDGKTNLITIEEALEKVTDNALLILVDHSKTALTLSQELLGQFREVIVVDHHRRDEDFPKNSVLTYIESGASSASELVTELIQFQDLRPRLTRMQASILMAGIMLDTKNFSTRVTSRTFDVASYLRTLGSDSVEIQNIAATDFDEYRQINELILRGERINGNIIVAAATEDKTYTNVIASKAADTLLTMAGIEATFVITRNVTYDVAISARSKSTVNVQRIMEKLGGGGHFNLAACQLSELSISEAYDALVTHIQQEIKKEET